MEKGSKISGLVLVMSMAAALAKASDAPGTLRFELRAEHFIVVQGSIGELRKVRLVLDTGATHTMIDRRVAKKLGLKEFGSTAAISLDRTLEMSLVRLPELAFGNVRATSVEALVADLSFLPLVGSIDATVGMDILGRLGFSVDYRKRTITFGTPSSTGRTLLLEPDFPVPVVRLKIDGESVRLMVDSGGRDLVLFEDRLSRRVRSNLRSIGAGSLSHGGGRSAARAVQVEHLEIHADRRATRTAFLIRVSADSYPGLDGVIGATALGGRRVHFDFPRSALGIEP